MIAAPDLPVLLVDFFLSLQCRYYEELQLQKRFKIYFAGHFAGYHACY